MATYNRDPYYDDFDAKKNYVKILFKPGVSVQARELTQLQTAIQEQIKTIGSNLFKNESLVTGGESRSFQVVWADFNTSADLSSYVGLSMVGGTSGAKLQVISHKNQVSSGVGRLYFVYKNGQKLETSEEVSEDSISPSVSALTLTASEDNTGMAIAFTISESVFYVKDYFVVCSEQTTILSDNITPSVKVGLSVTEDIATYQEDETLLDPSNGSYNYAAPGADRVSISLDLVTYPYDAVADSDAATMQENTEDNFIELARYSSGVLIKSIKNQTLGSLEDVLARRTYDESGDYTVREFRTTAVDNVKRQSEKLSLAIEPGKAYVKGYEFETSSTLYLDIDKAREYNTLNNFFGEAAFGDYFIINHPTGGVLSYVTNQEISLRNAGTTQIGTARVRFVSRHSATQLKVFVYQLKFTSGSSSDVASLSSASWTAVVDGSIVSGKNKEYIIPTNRSPIKTMTDISYETQVEMTVLATATTITGTTLSPGKTYPSSNPDDYIVVKATDGSVATGFTVSSSGGNAFVLSGTFSSVNYNVIAKVAVSTSAPKAKTRTPATVYLTNSTDKSISLGVSDVFKIISIQAAKSDDSVARIDVTGLYSLDRGQTDSMYDYGKLVLVDGQQPANLSTYDRLIVSLEYFAASQAEGYFTVDSYDTDSSNASTVVLYEEIPSFVASSGKTISLRDCVDFRPRRATVSSFPGTLASPISSTPNATIVGVEFARPGSFLTADLEYYIPRVDKLIITKEKKFDLIRGISSETPQIPTDIPDAMTIYTAFVPAYTFSASEVRLDYIDNRRYTMRDIGKIEKRVDRLEYYTAMTLLEKQAADETVTNSAGLEKFKNGILVDSFAGHSVGDVGADEYSCAVDTLTRTLRPRFSSESMNFEVNLSESSGNNYAKNDDIVTLPFATEIYVSNNQATKWTKINPNSTFSWGGEVKLNPATDNWSDTTTKPQVTSNANGVNDAYSPMINNRTNPGSSGMDWSFWQTQHKGINVNSIAGVRQSILPDGRAGSRSIQELIPTANLNETTLVNETRVSVPGSSYEVPSTAREVGSKLVDSSVVPYIRSRVIDFSATKMKPNTTLFAAFDGVDVTSYCTQAPVIFTTTAAKATRVRKIGTSKAADVILLKADRAYVKMDAGQSAFNVGDTVEWFVGSAWVTGSDVTDTSPQVEDLITTDENGDVAGYFLIPNDNKNRFLTGERSFRLADSLGKQPSTAAETKYIAQGLSLPTDKSLVSTRVNTLLVDPFILLSGFKTSLSAAVTEIKNKVKNSLVKPGETVSGSGGTGRFVYDIDFGTGTGLCGVNYDAFGVPDRYTIVWDGRTYTSGFRGKGALFSNGARFNNELNKLGFPSVTTVIDENNPETGKLRFNKTSAYPTKAQLIVDAPLRGTRWNWKAFNATSTDNLIAQADPRLSVLVDAPSTTITSFAAASRGGAMQTSDSGINFNFDVRIEGNQSIPTGTLVNITSLTRAESTTNGRWASLATGSRFFVNGSPASFPYSIRTGETVTFSVSADFTDNAKDQGLNAGGSLRNPVSSIVVNAELASPINGNLYSSTGSDSITHTTSYEKYEAQSPSQLAQTFFVSAKENPDGIFVDSVDLFFRAKDSVNSPVSIQIRTTDNGYPSSKTILPFATGEIMSNDIVLSSDSESTRAANRVEFKAPVYLAPNNEYAFVIQANSDKFEVFASKIGESLLSNSTVRCTKQPLAGSMFFSQNSTDWVASQSEDLVFRLRKCVFEANVEKPVVLNAEIPAILKNGSDVEFDTLFIDGELLDFANTNIDYSFKAARASSGIYAKDSTWNKYQLGSNLGMTERKSLSLQDQTTLRLQCTMKTENRDVSPVIDLNRLSAVLTKNIVNANGNSESAATQLVIQSVQATTDVVTVTTTATHSLSVGDVVFVVANTSNAINGTVTVTAVPTTTTFTFDRVDGGAAIVSTTQGGTVTRTAQALSRYITRKVTLNSDFLSSDIKVNFRANIPAECSVVPYYRVTTLTDSVLEDNDWVEMQLESTGNRNESGFAEYKYKPPFVVSGDTVAVNTGERFGTFSVKLVLLSTNPTKVPLVKDLRVMALDD